MRQPETLQRVNNSRLKNWLLVAGPPWLRTPTFFEEMGFPAWFVRRYFRKHRNALRLGGKIQRKVRGVNEVDILYGLAEALGIDSSEMSRRSGRHERIAALAHKCLRVLDAMDGDVDDKEQQCTVAGEAALVGTSQE